jgi:hypothetical protein
MGNTLISQISKLVSFPILTLEIKVKDYSSSIQYVISTDSNLVRIWGRDFKDSTITYNDLIQRIDELFVDEVVLKINSSFYSNRLFINISSSEKNFYFESSNNEEYSLVQSNKQAIQELHELCKELKNTDTLKLLNYALYIDKDELFLHKYISERILGLDFQNGIYTEKDINFTRNFNACVYFDNDIELANTLLSLKDQDFGEKYKEKSKVILIKKPNNQVIKEFYIHQILDYINTVFAYNNISNVNPSTKNTDLILHIEAPLIDISNNFISNCLVRQHILSNVATFKLKGLKLEVTGLNNKLFLDNYKNIKGTYLIDSSYGK